MIPADILIALFVMLFLIFAWLTLRWIADVLAGRRPTPRRQPQPSEPETHGDEGGMPAPADYSDEVTDEHLKRIREIVDHGKFENAEVVSGPAWSEPELPAFLKRTRGDQAALHSKYKRAGD